MLDQIIKDIPKEFLLATLDGQQAAFRQAKRYVDEVVCYEEPERIHMLGQHRHSACEQAHRQAARNCGLQTYAPHTYPLGGRFSLVRAGRFLLARAKVQTVGSPPRNSKFRRELALHNCFLEPYQLDMLREELELPEDTIFGLIITLAHKRDHDQSLPAFVGLGVPNSSLIGWHFRDSVEHILAAYSGVDRVELQDKVRPQLKQHRRRAKDIGKKAD